jgi:hypothetical protein
LQLRTNIQVTHLMNDRRYRGSDGTMQGSYPRMPGVTRMSEAEAYDLNLFVAPERLLKSRRMLASGLFQLDLIQVSDPSNDNRA